MGGETSLLKEELCGVSNQCDGTCKQSVIGCNFWELLPLLCPVQYCCRDPNKDYTGFIRTVAKSLPPHQDHYSILEDK